MCQKLPGLRCSTHALDKLEIERDKLDGLLEKAKTYIRTPSTLSNEIASQMQSVSQAEREYNCTNKGIALLSKKLEKAKTSKDDTSIAEAQFLLDRAQSDREDHQLAYKVIQKYSENIQHPINNGLVKKYRTEEESANTRLADVFNNRSASAQEKAIAKRESEKAKHNRIRAEHTFLREQSGILDFNVNDISNCADNIDNAPVYTYLKSAEFGKTSNYVPSGSYCQVTEIKPDGHGNFFMTIEGIRTDRVSKDKKLLMK